VAPKPSDYRESRVLSTGNFQVAAVACPIIATLKVLRLLVARTIRPRINDLWAMFPAIT
jgi:hypothetical protein